MSDVMKSHPKRYQLVDLIDEVVTAIRMGVIHKAMLFPSIMQIDYCLVEASKEEEGSVDIELRIKKP